MDDVQFVLCDLDGVVWLARTAIPGSPEAIARLRATGRRVVFVTNNSIATIADQEAALETIGIPARGDVVTSAQAAAFLVSAGERVLVCAGDGVVEAVGDRGATPVPIDGSDTSGPFDAVVVGLHQHFDYRGLHVASSAVRAGARFVATNDDPTFPTPEGPIPGAGALVAAVGTASGTDPVRAGKPHRPMAELVAQRCGPDFRPDRALVVGDRASTDGLFAVQVGCRFALVRSGVTPPGAATDAPSAAVLDVADLAAAVAAIVGGGS